MREEKFENVLEVVPTIIGPAVDQTSERERNGEARFCVNSLQRVMTAAVLGSSGLDLSPQGRCDLVLETYIQTMIDTEFSGIPEKRAEREAKQKSYFDLASGIGYVDMRGPVYKMWSKTLISFREREGIDPEGWTLAPY